MAHAVYPRITKVEDDQYMCEMVDKIKGRIWGAGYGASRQEAIYNARHDLPPTSKLNRSIGWLNRHKIASSIGLVTGLYQWYRTGKIRYLIDGVGISTILITTGWVVRKVVKTVCYAIGGIFAFNAGIVNGIATAMHNQRR